MSLPALMQAAGEGPVVASLVAGGVDYFRHTLDEWEVQEAGGGDGLWLAALHSLGYREEPRALRPVSMVGYSGYGVGGAAILTSATGKLMLQVSSSPAHAYAESKGAWGSISRLDVQMTVRPSMPVDEAVVRVYQNLLRRTDERKERGRWFDTRLVYDRAATCYSGRRTRNGVMMRFYNAGAVHGEKDPAMVGCMRVEMEITGPRARDYGVVLRQQGWEVDACLAMVGVEADRRGAALDCSGTLEAPGVCRSRKMAPDQESTLRWMRTQVRKAAERLMREGIPRELIVASIVGPADATAAD